MSNEENPSLQLAKDNFDQELLRLLTSINIDGCQTSQLVSMTRLFTAPPEHWKGRSKDFDIIRNALNNILDNLECDVIVQNIETLPRS